MADYEELKKLAYGSPRQVERAEALALIDIAQSLSILVDHSFQRGGINGG